MRNTFATTMIAATALALPAAASTLVDPNNPTPEDEAKLEAAKAFLEKGETYYSTVTITTEDGKAFDVAPVEGFFTRNQ